MNILIDNKLSDVVRKFLYTFSDNVSFDDIEWSYNLYLRSQMEMYLYEMKLGPCYECLVYPACDVYRQINSCPLIDEYVNNYLNDDTIIVSFDSKMFLDKSSLSNNVNIYMMMKYLDDFYLIDDWLDCGMYANYGY